jgi:methylenetetrahydrofolate dehydrogenase (NADP+) / methenyltetrahydrofolate cyclohydrolase
LSSGSISSRASAASSNIPNTVADEAEFQRFFAGNAKREQNFRKKGSTLIGDVHPEVAEIAEALTPVPGGVGPLTIAMLIFNTVKAAKMRRAGGRD